jgi:hypothetical protein
LGKFPGGNDPQSPLKTISSIIRFAYLDVDSGPAPLFFSFELVWLFLMFPARIIALFPLLDQRLLEVDPCPWNPLRFQEEVKLGKTIGYSIYGDPGF